MRRFAGMWGQDIHRHRVWVIRSSLRSSFQPSFFYSNPSLRSCAFPLSQITVSIFDNPANSVLAPTADSTVTVLKGIVTFNNLFIDKAGLGFSLKFDLVGTLVTVLSTKFDVLNGPVSVLSIAQAPEDAWAGGQPFQTQPHIELQDYGGNVITTDSVTSISCVVVPSLASTNDLVVTTTTSPPVNVTNVKYAAATLEKVREWGKNQSSAQRNLDLFTNKTLSAAQFTRRS